MDEYTPKRKVKKKLSIFKRILKLLVIISFLLCICLLLKGFFFSKIGTQDVYISSSNQNIKLYNDNYEEVGSIPRGTKVKGFLNKVKNNDLEYQKIIYDNKTYFIESNNIEKYYSNSIKETVMYVRTPVTIYKDETSPNILGFLPKGTEVEIKGFDKIDNGLVNKYKITYDEKDGYVYAKYLVNTKELALANYNENGIYDIHKDRKYSMELYGGHASDLDYYPYSKAKFDNNTMPNECRTFYLNATPKVLNNIDKYISLAKENKINCFVVDIKDGFLAYQSDVAKEYSNTAYSSSDRTVEDYKKVIDKLKDNEFYTIGRIVAFNDSHFAGDNPNDTITSNDGTNTKWTSAFSRKAWEYNVKLALEAVNKIGFNEIQYDYVRFPDSSYSMSKDNYDFKNKYKETKGQAIQNFILYAADQIHEAGAYFSVDVFGECANTYVTAYGQYWPAISNIVDVISAMPYPDHFNKYDYGFNVPVWTVPYDLLSKWGSSASSRQKEIKTPAKVRTWIQVYDAIHDPRVPYDTNMVSNEIKALYEQGLNNGFITWNSVSSIDKYTEVASAFKEDYR